MVKEKKKFSELRRSIGEALEEVRGRQPKQIKVSLGEKVGTDVLSGMHSRFTKVIGFYFPVRVDDGPDGTAIEFFLDAEMLSKLSKADDIDARTNMPKDLFDLICLAYRDGRNVKEGHWNIEVRELLDIDGASSSYEADDIEELLSHRGEGTSLCVIARERVAYAYRMLLSFMTLVGKRDMEWAGLAMLHSSFRMGSELGIPLEPLQPSKWAERMGTGQGFPDLVEKTYDFLFMEQCIGTLFPMLRLWSRSKLLREYEACLDGLREGRLHETLPQWAVEDIGMDRDAIRERVIEKGGVCY
ncbi:MAG TPA: hypothetical protein PK718_07945 [Candidatus Methanofastidiosa archaeon]|nr:hypothetical protein [Candidatus Methanofastidiosa archaeon]HPR42455.1 hypothetical protein [Candidatus Methanofastidiosa archaeon]